MVPCCPGTFLSQRLFFTLEGTMLNHAESINFWGWVQGAPKKQRPSNLQMHLLHVVPCSFEKSHRFLPHKIISIKVTLLPFLHHSISKQMALAEASCVCMSVHACDLMHVIKCVSVCVRLIILIFKVEMTAFFPKPCWAPQQAGQPVQ